jgi:KUP system potassium uptake protein
MSSEENPPENIDHPDLAGAQTANEGPTSEPGPSLMPPDEGSSSVMAAAIQEPTGEEGPHHHHNQGPLGLLMLSALGVVYGDIGTSPLYAMRETFHHSFGLHPDQETLLGVLSLITWSLILVVSVKYLAFVMRADLHGEGGILTLTGLVSKSAPDPTRRSIVLITLLGLFGTALLYGEGIITPAISVLSAVEGLNVATPVFQPYILPITIAILIALFSIQSGGTEKVGRIFGPITLVWFITLFGLGAYHISDSPVVVKALNPLLGLGFLLSHGWTGFLVLGSVVLVVTGAEALYADMGHFGRKPIRWAWFIVVLPSLLVNYYGQAALILARPDTADNPFFKMVPPPLLYPVVALATMATVIASQALISGSYSMTMQAIRLGYLPRLKVVHTSERAVGQIYVPVVNWVLMISCIALVLGFKSSSALAAAYGLAVTGAMVTTTLLLFFVSQNLWKWPLAASLGLCSFFMVIDVTFLGANIVKIPAGGWFPLVVGAILFTVLTTWYKGRSILGKAMQPMSISVDQLFERFKTEPPLRVEGTGVFLAGVPRRAPPALLNNLKHYHVLHERVVLVSVSISDRSKVDQPFRIRVEDLGQGFYQVRLRFGYLERCDVPGALATIPELDLRPATTTYYLGREIVIPTVGGGMAMWRERLFATLSHNSLNATAFFHIPPDRVVEVGSQVCI